MHFFYLIHFFQKKTFNMAELRIGTCSWKYDSWRGIVYSSKPKINYLEEYSARYNTVEIDQWFWSLFDDIIKLPEKSVVKEYNDSVPEDFKFTIKVPNSITLTHYYAGKSNPGLKPNPNFLNPDLFHQFLKTLEPMGKKIGVLMFQFEYMNKQKMDSWTEFVHKLESFIELIDRVYNYAIELRNPNYLNQTYFEFLTGNNLSHVVLEGYFMPSLKEVFSRFKDSIKCNPLILRLHGPDRKQIEGITGGDWSKSVLPKDDKIKLLPSIINFFLEKEIDVYVNVNNHFEGSAPLTIEKIRRLIEVTYPK
ncbi:MAG TPA: DUF72 domain-containing protein [Ignavibacteriaceae bacterium]|nr:DUF72 domain-containing protein [Ignavibacteriaceae bacterium]